MAEKSPMPRSALELIDFPSRYPLKVFGNHDTEFETIVLELVKALVAEHDMTALLISHQPNDALVASARTAFICEGRVSTLAPTAELLAAAAPTQLRDYLGSQ